MNTFKVTMTDASNYHGCGHALAAITDNQTTAFVYVRDIACDYDDKSENALWELLGAGFFADTIKDLAEHGEVHMGMISCWEFCSFGKVTA